MTTVQKFILSGDWSMSVDKGKLANFVANFSSIVDSSALAAIIS